MYRSARRFTRAGLREGQHAMTRHKDLIPDDDGVAAGASQSHYVPVVENFVLMARHGQEAGRGLAAVFVVGREQHAQQRPGRVVAVGGKAPLVATQHVATRHGTRFAGRRVGAAHQRGRVFTPDFFLGLQREQAAQPLMHIGQAEAPAGRCTAAADLDDQVHEFGIAVFEAAPACRQHDLVQLGLADHGRGIGRDATGALGVLCPLLERGQQAARALDQVVGRGPWRRGSGYGARANLFANRFENTGHEWAPSIVSKGTAMTVPRIPARGFKHELFVIANNIRGLICCDAA